MFSARSRSSIQCGSGTISIRMIATAHTAAAASPREDRLVMLGKAVADMGLTTQPPDQRQHLGDGAVEVRRDLLSDFGPAVQGPRERRVLDDRDIVARGEFADALRDQVLPLG